MTYPPSPHGPANPGYPTDTFHLAQMAPPRRRKLWPWILAAALVLAVAAGGTAAWWLARPDPAPAASATGPTVAAAHAACEEAVKVRLKAPGSAKFGGQAYKPAPDRGYPAEVTGWVDSQNSFGALVRNRYTCLAHQGDGGWRISDVEFEEW